MSFLQEANATAYSRTPGVMMDRGGIDRVARRHRADRLGGLGFGLKWNMGWMNDTLRYVAARADHRR